MRLIRWLRRWLRKPEATRVTITPGGKQAFGLRVSRPVRGNAA